MIKLFLIGFILGLFCAFLGEKLPTRLPDINEEKTSSWILNLFIGTISGILLIFSFIEYDFSYEFWTSIIVGMLFLIIFISDFKYMIILDSPLIIGSLIILGLKAYYFGWKSVGLALISGLVLFLLMLLIGILGGKIFKKEALGGGDIKLAFVIGIILGLRLGLISIIMSSLLALPYALACLMLHKNNEVPYGPFIVSSLVLVFIFIEKFQNVLNLL